VLDISGGDDRRTFYASLGNTYQNGTIVGDHDTYNRTTGRLKATQFFGNTLRVGGNISYMDVRARYVQKGNNLNGILLGLARTPPDFDNFPYVVDGLHRSYRYPNPDPADPLADRVYDNPFWVINRDENTSDVNRAIGNFDISWDALQWLNLKYTFGADYSSDQRISGFRHRAPVTRSRASSGRARTPTCRSTATSWRPHRRSGATRSTRRSR
jgi:hypothetical protein